MTQTKTARWLIVTIVDSVLLGFSMLLLYVDFLTAKDIIWSVAALLGVFIFSARLGRDIRRRRAQ